MYKRREHILAAVTAIFLAMCHCQLGCGGSGGPKAIYKRAVSPL